jgi:TIR- and PNP-associating SLOG family
MALKDRFVGIDGSASDKTDVDLVRRCHHAVRRLTRGILQAGGGVVVSAGGEECLIADEPETARVFYWTVLDEVHAFMKERRAVGDSSERCIAKVVCSQKARDEKIPAAREAQLQDLLDARALDLKLLKANWNAGAYIREHQAGEGDALVILGGGEGVEHLASLYVKRNRPVIPLDPKLGGYYADGNGGAAALYNLARSRPEKFVEQDPHRLPSELDLLSLQRAGADPIAVADRLVGVLQRVVLPRVFFTRLLNPAVPEFVAVDNFFGDVVAPCIQDLGYQADQIGSRPGTDGFLNREIFERLHNAAVVVADLTALRLNNFHELGYAQGRSLKLIISAMEGTVLPFDVGAMPVYFWNKEQPTTDRRRLFREFWSKNIGRPFIVQPRELG